MKVTSTSTPKHNQSFQADLMISEQAVKLCNTVLKEVGHKNIRQNLQDLQDTFQILTKNIDGTVILNPSTNYRGNNLDISYKSSDSNKLIETDGPSLINIAKLVKSKNFDGNTPYKMAVQGIVSKIADVIPDNQKTLKDKFAFLAASLLET